MARKSTNRGQNRHAVISRHFSKAVTRTLRVANATFVDACDLHITSDLRLSPRCLPNMCEHRGLHTLAPGQASLIRRLQEQQTQQKQRTLVSYGTFICR